MEVAVAAWSLLVLGAVGGQTPATMGAGLTPMVPTQQSLQSALFSIDERLRALDSYYSIRYGGRWDVETYVRRLESIETRIGRLETLLELRTDKLLEALTSYQMKDTQTKEHINRKIDSLYDRLIHRIAYMENRIDTDVAKIQSSVESGFVRISRAERDSEIAEVETQLDELRRRFDEFDRNQNRTLTLLLETWSSRGSTAAVLNDGGADIGGRGRDVDQVAASVDNVASKVNKMFNDLSHQSQTLEGLVKNSMSLTNATRREIQEGFKTLGHRKIVMQQGNKQNKEKEAATSLEGWDALSNLLSKEFGNLVRKIDSNYEDLSKDHTAFIDGCHRVQENESQLEAEIAAVLERILDRIHNRSHDMEKQVVALQEMLKTHNSNVIRTIGHSTNTAMQSSQYAKQLEATILQAVGQHRGLEKLGEGLSNVLEGIKVLQNQLGEGPVSAASENVLETCPRKCPDESAIADKILSALKLANTETQGLSAASEAYIERAVERTLEVYRNNSIPGTIDRDQTEAETGEASFDNVRFGSEDNENVKVLDIPANEERVGETMEYNVTREEIPTKISNQTANTNPEGVEPQRGTEEARVEGERQIKTEIKTEEEGDISVPTIDNGTETPSDYELFERGSAELDRSEQLYYDEITDGAFEEENAAGKQGENETAEPPQETKAAVESALEVSTHVLKVVNSSVDVMNATKDDGLKAESNVDNSTANLSSNQTHGNASTQGETENSQASDPLFSKFWHRIVSASSSNETLGGGDLSLNVDTEETEPKGQQVDEKVNLNVEETNNLDSEREEIQDELFEEFGSYVPPSR